MPVYVVYGEILLVYICKTCLTVVIGLQLRATYVRMYVCSYVSAFVEIPKGARALACKLGDVAAG